MLYNRVIQHITCGDWPFLLSINSSRLLCILVVHSLAFFIAKWYSTGWGVVTVHVTSPPWKDIGCVSGLWVQDVMQTQVFICLDECPGQLLGLVTVAGLVLFKKLLNCSPELYIFTSPPSTCRLSSFSVCSLVSLFVIFTIVMGVWGHLPVVLICISLMTNVC